ncbi:hypothetical protein CIG75_08510 [Tumebacillus algifaecis]|uniref:Uncharacterized protein n=1 Tax=Tumebacillus algifaecis TaxID=1214604 RepID=A0A223D0Y2_9BACL|nr:hypothetical protein [Tumebacillus algifaecis]ASS75024.1 hypothetical protein CIG75_08510 [Tumebacillus algifaecis]
MTMNVLKVFTQNIEVFSDLYHLLENLSLTEGQETEVEGVKVSGGGQVDEEYLDTMRVKLDVAVLKVKPGNVTILQHSGMFEVLFPE